ncbi:MAG: hypothetical protein QW379_09905 [Thermoplasmata archaeon]
MKTIDEVLDEAKRRLVEYFRISPFVVWKEEDLQGFLFHSILDVEPLLIKRLHREFPIVLSYKPRNWAGLLDLAIINDFDGNINVNEVKIDYAIELKFMRHWKTGLSPKSLRGFKKECEKDLKKLQSNAINFHAGTKKFFWAFRITDISQEIDVDKIFAEIEWNDIEHQYFESLIERK